MQREHKTKCLLKSFRGRSPAIQSQITHRLCINLQKRKHYAVGNSQLALEVGTSIHSILFSELHKIPSVAKSEGRTGAFFVTSSGSASAAFGDLKYILLHLSKKD